MPLRLAFDLDGVLADMHSALARESDQLFGPRPKLADPTEPPEAADERAGADRTENESALSAAADAGPAAAAGGDGEDLPAERLWLTGRQRRRLWQRVGRIDSFWENLREIEPGAVARLSALAFDRRWEVIFLTQRPETAGATAQIQSQRWLERHGFTLPSVYVVRGSRGRIADALDLDLVIDDRAENCLDVAVESRARAVLIWRGRTGPISPNVTQLGISVVDSVMQCLDALADLPRPGEDRGGWFERLKKMLAT